MSLLFEQVMGAIFLAPCHHPLCNLCYVETGVLFSLRLATTLFVIYVMLKQSSLCTGEDADHSGGKHDDTPVIKLCDGVSGFSRSHVQLHQVGTCGGTGMPLGLVVNDKCVSCKNSNHKCVHKNHYARSQGQGGDDSGGFLP
jgi:hypothetical protein